MDTVCRFFQYLILSKKIGRDLFYLPQYKTEQ